MTGVIDRPTVLTATQASRGFADVLERARAGESFSVTRNGRQVARILPPDPPKPNGAALLAFLESWEGGAFNDETEQLVLGMRQPNPEAESEDLSWVNEYR